MWRLEGEEPAWLPLKHTHTPASSSRRKASGASSFLLAKNRSFPKSLPCGCVSPQAHVSEPRRPVSIQPRVKKCFESVDQSFSRKETCCKTKTLSHRLADRANLEPNRVFVE